MTPDLSKLDYIKKTIFFDLQTVLKQHFHGSPVTEDIFNQMRAVVAQQMKELNSFAETRIPIDISKLDLHIESDAEDKTLVRISPKNLYTGLILFGCFDYSPEEVEAKTIVEFENELQLNWKFETPAGAYWLYRYKEVPAFQKQSYHFEFYPNSEVQYLSLTVPIS